MIQLTEQEARELFSDINILSFNQHTPLSLRDIDYIIGQLKEKGYIEKPKLEKAREFYELKKNDFEIHDFYKLKEFHEEVVKELAEAAK